jgi:hypothetical protein
MNDSHYSDIIRMNGDKDDTIFQLCHMVGRSQTLQENKVYINTNKILSHFVVGFFLVVLFSSCPLYHIHFGTVFFSFFWSIHNRNLNSQPHAPKLGQRHLMVTFFLPTVAAGAGQLPPIGDTAGRWFARATLLLSHGRSFLIDDPRCKTSKR